MDMIAAFAVMITMLVTMLFLFRHHWLGARLGVWTIPQWIGNHHADVLERAASGLPRGISTTSCQQRYISPGTAFRSAIQPGQRSSSSYIFL